MSTGADDGERKLVTLLEVLYEPGTARRLAAALLDRVRPGDRIAGTGDRSVDRVSSLLITYADSIRAEGEVPLETLRVFLRRHVGGHIGAVHLLPFYPSSSDDGFAVVDYRRVDHHLGGWEHVQALGGDYPLMFDLVINHCSRENLWFADFVSGREPGRHYFITLPEESDTTAVVRPRSTPLISPIQTYAGIRHVWTTFSADQIDLDFTNPDVLAEFVDILFFYVARGARLIRLDAVAFLWKRLGTSCMSLPETHAVVRVLRLLLELAGADVRLVTETNVPHDENVSYFGAGDEAHMIYQFSLAPLMAYSYVFGDAGYLTRWARALAPPPEGATFLNFIASHDGIGLRPLEGLVPDAEVARLVDRMHERGGFVTLREVGDGSQRPYEINIALFSALGGADNLPAYLGAHTLLLSFQGVPALYIHSLLASPNDLDLVEQTGRTRSINRGHWQLPALDAALADPSSIQSRVLGHLRLVLACREAQPAMAPGAQQLVLPAPPGVFLMRRWTPAQTVLVAASVRPEPQRLDRATLDLAPGRYAELLSGRTVRLHDGLALEPYEVLWLQIS